MNRRNFLKCSAASMTAATTTSLTSLLSSVPAIAQTNDYKALVCVFLYGGMDNYDTIIPYDNASYNRWAQIRSGLLNKYPTPRSQANLLPLTTPNRFGARQFALPPEMPGLHALYQSGNAAVMGNVGPLLANINAAQFNGGTAPLPARLFSHNDQQSTWMSGNTEGAQYGWAGQVHDELQSSGVSTSNTFSAITMSSGDLLITGQQTVPYHLIGGEALDIIALKPGYTTEPAPNQEYRGSETLSIDGLPADLDNYFSTHHTEAYQNLLKRDIGAKQQNSYRSNESFNQAIADASSNVNFPNTGIGQQLASVYKVIQAKNALGANRQVFVVSMGGFDTHSDQPASLSALQSALDNAISSFYSALNASGQSQEVTLFTASDFGRTLAFNGDGTDHGWGGHHFVVGGAVNGGTIYGDIPVADFGHDLDAGAGRLIPTTSIEQYAANFASWMGLSESSLNSVFPGIASFGERPRFMG